MRYISRFKNSIRASSVYSLAFMLTFALAAGLTTYEEAAAQTPIKLSADHDNTAVGNQTDITEAGGVQRVEITATLDGPANPSGDNIIVTLTVAPEDEDRYEVTGTMEITINGGNTSGNVDLTFTPEDDGIYHSDLKINITGEATGRFVEPTSLTLLDNDQDVTLSFAAYDGSTESTLVISTSVSEMDAEDQEQEVVLWARVMEAPRSAMDVPVTVSRNRSRYSVTGDLTIEIAAGDLLGKTTLKISPVDNDRFDEPADITVSVGGGLNARSVKISVRDADETRPTLKVEASPDKVNEDGGDSQIVNVTATLDGDPLQTATKVTLAVTDDSDADRYSVSGTMSITISAGRTSNSTNLAFSPEKDAIFYDDLPITITGSSDYDPDPKASATVTLRDDDQEVTLSVSPTSVTEKEGTAEERAQKVTITAMLQTSKPKEFTIPLEIVTGDRYQLSANMPTITIDAGDDSGTVEVTVTTTDNMYYNKDEDIMVSVSKDASRDNSSLAARPVAIKLTDDEDKPKLEIALSDDEVLESDGADQDITVTATLKGAAPATGDNADVTIEVTPADPDGTRYSVTGNEQPIDIDGGGSTDSNGNLTLDFTVTEDGVFHQDLELTITAKADGYDTVTKTVTVRDDDQDVTLSFAAYNGTDPLTLVRTANVAEGEGEEEEQEVVVWARVMEAPRSSMDVPISVSRNRARYSVTGDLTIELAAGDFLGKTTLKFTPVENDRYDEPEDITVSVGGGLNARTVKITLNDMDETKPTLKVEASPDKLNEDGGDTQIVSVTATLDGAPVQKATTVTLEVKPDEASRYSVSGDLEITISAGNLSNSTNLAFVPVKDGIFNQDLPIVVTGKSDPDYGSSDATVTLRDDDHEVALMVSPSTVTETDKADDAAQKVTITAMLQNTTPKEYMVPLTVADNNRYTVDNASPEITIDAGDDSGEVEITITPTNNDFFNKDEDIMVSVTVASNLAARPVAINLTDDEDKPKLELALDADAVFESVTTGQDITATATLKGAALPSGTNTEVTFKVTPEDPDMDRYSLTNANGNTETSTINGGGNADSETTATFNFSVTQDGKFFQDQVLTVTATAEGFDTVTKTVTVRDDDQDLTLSFETFGENDDPTIATSVMEMEGEEEEQEVVVWARLMDAPTKSTDVPISVSRNRARYSVTGDLTIEVGAGDFLGKTTLKITPVENDRYDLPAKIDVTVGGGLTARKITVTLNDMDEKEPALKVEASPDKVNEDGGDTQIVSVTATLDGDPVQTATTVTLEVKPEEASRYSVSGTMEITIPAGGLSNSTNLSFVPVKDGIFNQDLPIVVTGSSDPNYDPDPKATATVTLRDDDQEITLSVSPSSVTETDKADDAAQKVTITATMAEPPARDFSVALMVLVVDESSARVTVDNALPEITIDAGETSGEVEITITPEDNEYFNKDEDIMVSVTVASNLAARPVAINWTDDEDKPKLELALDADAVFESVTTGQDITATATLKGAALPSGTNTEVTFKVTPEDPDMDRYSLTNANGNTETSTINGGQNDDSETTATFNFSVTQDGKFFQDQVLTVTASADGFDSVTKTVTVRDDDQDLTLSFETFGENDDPTIATSVMEMEGEEEEQEVVVWARLMDAPTKSTDVPISVSRNRARYSVTGDLTIEVGAGDFLGKTTLKITPVENDRYDLPAKIDVTVGGGLTARKITVTLNDMDEKKPALKLAASPGTVTEGSGAQDVVVTAKLDGDAVQTATTVTLEVKPEEDDRYSVSGDMEITIPAGSKSGTTDLSFTVVEDLIFFDDLTVTVTGSSDPNYDPDPKATATVTIADDDQEINLSAAPTYITEDGGAEQKVTITAMVTGTPPKQDMTVPLSITEQTTRFSMNTDIPSPGGPLPLISIKAGATSGEVTVIFSVDDNDDYNGSIDIDVGIANSSELTARDLKIRLIDDEEIHVTLASSVSELMEAGGMTTEVEVTATLSGKLPGTTTVALSKTGTATKGVDYSVTGEGTIEIAAGETEGSTTLMITPVDDFMAEGEGTETIVIGGSAGDLRVNSASINLIDNNAVGVAMVMVEPDMITEGGDATDVVITVTLASTSSEDLEIGLDKSRGSATPGDDFMVSVPEDAPEKFVIAAGDSVGMKTVIITPVENDDMGNKEIMVDAWTMNEDGVRIGEKMSDIIVITDNDQPLASVTVDVHEINEHGEAAEVTITVELASAIGEDLMVGLDKSNGTATLGEDFTVTVPEDAPPFIIVAGGTMAMKTVTITPINDEEVEGQEEILVEAWTMNTDGEQIGAKVNTGIILHDDESIEGLPLASVTVDVHEINEDGEAVEVTITVELASATGEDLMIGLDKSNGTATLGEDFTVTVPEDAPPFIIAAGGTMAMKTVTITPINDEEVEGQEEILVEAWTMNMDGEQIGAKVNTGIILHDDDDDAIVELPLVTLSVDNMMFIEGVDGTMTITASAAGTVPVPQVIALVPVTDHTTIDLADAPALFAKFAAGVTITIPPNETTGEMVIPISTLDDMEFEGDEVAVVIGLVVATQTNTNPIQIVLADNDAPTVTITPSTATLTESGGAQRVTFTAEMTSGAVESPTELHLSVVDGTATTADYSSAGGMVTIPAGMTSGSADLTITVTADEVYEPTNETIVVSAGYRTHVGLANVPLMITDDFAAPAVTSALPSISIEAGETWTGDVASSFTGKALAYSASSTGDAASANISGSALEVNGERAGSARVTVTATNAAGNASFEMDVSVTAIAAEQMVYTDILAAMGRNVMSSVSQTIGGRFSVNAAERQIALANRRVNGMASGMETLISLTGTQATTKYGITDENSQRYNRQQVSTRELIRGSSFYYALDDAPDSHMGGGLAWTIWGAGDWNAFEGAPTATSSYDGTLTSGYVGLDVSKTASWIAGVAVGRTMGTADYDLTVTDGTLETTLNSIYPYVHWTGPGCCIEVWGIGGFGTGEAEANAMTSDLSMSLGMVGLRAQLVGGSSGGLDLDLIGDAGITKLSTSGGESASLSDLEASVQRVRIGLEASRTSDMGNGMLVTPFAQVAGRYDGGDGQTGNGLEVAGGLRIAGGRAGLEARGRLLAMHTGDDVKEHGVSVVAYVRPMGSGGQGLSMSLAPRMGADTEMTNNMWREEPTSDVRLSSRSGAAVKAEIGYGLVHPMMSSLLVTPFGTMDMAGDDQRRMRLGARFGGAIGTKNTVLSLEFAGERIEGSNRTTEHRIGLLGRMSF